MCHVYTACLYRWHKKRFGRCATAPRVGHSSRHACISIHMSAHMSIRMSIHMAIQMSTLTYEHVPMDFCLFVDPVPCGIALPAADHRHARAQRHAAIRPCARGQPHACARMHARHLTSSQGSFAPGLLNMLRATDAKAETQTPQDAAAKMHIAVRA